MPCILNSTHPRSHVLPLCNVRLTARDGRLVVGAAEFECENVHRQNPASPPSFYEQRKTKKQQSQWRFYSSPVGALGLKRRGKAQR